MREITLKNGGVAKVDDEDFPHLSQYEWSKRKSRRQDYAYGRLPGQRQWTAMHVLLMKPAPGEEVDHRNSDGLDNQRQNLRNTTRSQNQANRRKALKASTKLKGVSKNRQCDPRFRYRTAITKEKKTYGLGSYSHSRKAGLIYDAAAKILFGEHALLNFPADASEKYRKEVVRMMGQIEREGRAVPTRR